MQTVTIKELECLKMRTMALKDENYGKEHFMTIISRF